MNSANEYLSLYSRYKVENYFCRIEDWRRIVVRYDKLARSLLAPHEWLARSTGSSYESTP
jgi:transposase